MEFSNKEILFLLFILPLFFWIYILRTQARSKKLIQILGKNRTFLTSSISTKARLIKFILSLSACGFFILSLARPQWTGPKQEAERAGIHMILAIDISPSMLAEDIKPSRLKFMKRELAQLINLSKGDKIALIAFSSEAALISPFTHDRSIVNLYLKDLSPDYLSSRGSNFNQLLSQVERAFQGLKNKEKTATKVVILASDGEIHEDISSSSLQALAQQDIRFFTLSFGTEEGGVIPIKNKKGQITSYKRNLQNEVVITKLKPGILKKIAKLSKGAYYHVGYGGKAIETLRADMNELEKTVFESYSTYKKKEFYQWFLVLGLFLAFLELLLQERRARKK